MILTGKPGDVPHPFRACSEVVLMSIYEKLDLIISLLILTISILTYLQKK